MWGKPLSATNEAMAPDKTAEIIKMFKENFPNMSQEDCQSIIDKVINKEKPRGSPKLTHQFIISTNDYIELSANIKSESFSSCINENKNDKNLKLLHKHYNQSLEYSLVSKESLISFNRYENSVFNPNVISIFKFESMSSSFFSSNIKEIESWDKPKEKYQNYYKIQK